MMVFFKIQFYVIKIYKIIQYKLCLTFYIITCMYFFNVIMQGITNFIILMVLTLELTVQSEVFNNVIINVLLQCLKL